MHHVLATVHFTLLPHRVGPHNVMLRSLEWVPVASLSPGSSFRVTLIKDSKWPLLSVCDLSRDTKRLPPNGPSPHNNSLTTTIIIIIIIVVVGGLPSGTLDIRSCGDESVSRVICSELLHDVDRSSYILTLHMQISYRHFLNEYTEKYACESWRILDFWYQASLQ